MGNKNMKNDLISRKSILNKIGEWSSKLDCENSKQSTLSEFEYMVANEPTVYDVDKVLEKMQTELNLADKEKERCARENHLQFDEAKGYARGIATALEIIKFDRIE